MRPRLFLFLAFALALCGSKLMADTDTDRFQNLLLKASKESSLVAPGSRPFHLKLSAAETYKIDPENNRAEIEIWWAGPDKWRRDIKSPRFSQTAVQNGAQYYESNSSDYLPFWIHELVQEATDPVPVEQLKNENVEMNRGGCAEWESDYTAGPDQIGVHHSVCFNADGTIGQLFAPTIAAELGLYNSFEKKNVARHIKVWPGSRAEVLGVITKLEKLHADESLFGVTKDTGFDSRVRFVSVPESALESYKLSTPAPTWPEIHNFPATGALTVNARIDRAGVVREVGSPISRNVVVNDAAVAQIKTWKFKPYPDTQHPVEVDTYLTLRFASKVLLLGGNGKAITENFFQHITNARQLSDPRTPGSKPFHLHATFLTGDNAPGVYEEFWTSTTQWWRQVRLGDITVLKSESGDKLFTKNTGSAYTPKEIDFFLDSLDIPFPRTDGSFIEGDWGHSAVKFEGVDMIRVARGEVDDQNRPISGQAYWFDSNDLLHAAYWDPKTTSYKNFQSWNDKQVARRIELMENGAPLLSITIDLIEAPPRPLDESFFVIKDVQPQSVAASENYEGPVIVRHQVAPDKPLSGHGTVLVNVQLDQHGHVVGAKVRQSGGPELDEAALRAAKQWEFSPMQIRGKPVPATIVLRFDF